MHEGGRKAILVALTANAGIAISKVAGFALTGAASMLAEAIHSVADTGNQALLILGGKQAGKAPDEAHPFGYGRERFFWAFVVSIVLFSLGSLFALYEGVHKLLHPKTLESPQWAIGILLVALALEGLSFRTAHREADKLRGDESWARFIRRTKNPELSVVLLEDSGALIGLVFALAGIGTAEITGNPRFDAVGSLAIGLLLGLIATVLAVKNKSLLIGESADPAMLDRIRNAISDDPEVTHLIHLRTLQLGPEELLVAAKLSFLPRLDQVAVIRAIDSAEKRIRAAVPEANLIFLEPDQYREGASPVADF